MSLLERAIQNQEQLTIESDAIQEAIYSCQSGKDMTEASYYVVESKEMDEFFSSICIDNTRYQEISLVLLQYIGQMMQLDPEKCIDNFVRYINSLLSNTPDEEDVSYYNSIVKSIKSLGDSREYKEYLIKYMLFQNDNSEEAIRARDIINKKLEIISSMFH